MKSSLLRKITFQSITLFFVVSFLLSCEENIQTENLSDDNQQVSVSDEELEKDQDYQAMVKISLDVFEEYRSSLKSSGISIDEYKNILLTKNEKAAEQIFKGKKEFFTQKIKLMNMHLAVLGDKYPSLLNNMSESGTYEDYILSSEKSINNLDPQFLTEFDAKNLYKCPPSYFRCMAIAFGTGGICVVSTAGLVSWACVLLYGFQAVDCVLSHCDRV